MSKSVIAIVVLPLFLYGCLPDDDLVCCLDDGGRPGSMKKKSECDFYVQDKSICVHDYYDNKKRTDKNSSDLSRGNYFSDYLKNETFSDVYVSVASNAFNVFPDTYNKINPFNCVEECNDNTGHCGLLNVNSEGNVINKASLTRAVDVLSNSKTNISKEVFMDIFSLENDPCNRSDIEILDDEIKNIGDGCVINEFVNNSKGVLVSIPNKIHVTRTNTENEVILTMNNPEKTISLKFTNKDPEKVELMNKEYAGKVTRMDLSGNNAVVSTTAGCVNIDF